MTYQHTSPNGISQGNQSRAPIVLLIATLMLLVGSLLPASATTSQMERAKLRAEVVVDDRLVTLGDLFENAGQYASKAVFRSPSIGQSGTIRSERVAEAAQRAGLVSIDLNNIQVVEVTRDSDLVTVTDIRDGIRSQLQAKGYVSATGRIDIELDSYLADQHAEPGMIKPFTISDLRFERSSGRFSARLTIAGRQDLGAFRINGTATETVLLPVMTRNMRQGEIVLKSDIAMVPLPKRQAVLGEPVTIDSVVGLAARQTLRIGQIASNSYFAPPNIIQRSDIVTIMYQTGSLTLSLRGKALSEGAKGDVIAVQNHQSNRIIQAEVVGPDLLMVTSPLNTISALTTASAQGATTQ